MLAPVGIGYMLPVPWVLVMKPVDAHFFFDFVVLGEVPLLYGAELIDGRAVLTGDSPPVVSGPAVAV